ncbi:MAG: ABC transporter ATP-binding protein [Lachnospiraceae bacterium]|nr:ABC transporter ATP-binding protein [Lachnospiraceae bacterium]
MGKLFKNVLPYWKTVIIIFMLLIVQAYCDLSLPQYTSDMIDTGIQNGGISHILPEKMTKEDYEYARMLMTEEEGEKFAGAYEFSGNFYELKVEEEEELETLDKELLIPIVLSHQMSTMEESTFKEMVIGTVKNNPEMEGMTEQIRDMSVADIQEMFQMEISTFDASDEEGTVKTYVDIRPLIAMMIESGQMNEEMLFSSRETMEKTIESIGESTVHSMGIAFAKACDTRAGIDVEELQIKYLSVSGAKMVGMTMIMVVAAILLGYFASRVGAGIGRDLRGKIFSNVVSFSNSEMDRFSAASLITRSTNDIQQIQMVTAMMLRMVLYAPVLGVGGIIKVVNTGANMGWIIVLAVVVILGFVLLLMSVAMPKFKLMQSLVDKVNLVSREILTGLNVIRAFGREKTEEERFDQANQELTRTQLFTNRVMTFMMPGMTMIMYGVTLLIVWVASKNIDAGTLQVGQMTAFITYSMMIIMAFLMLTAMSIMLPRAGVAAERIDEVLRTSSSVTEKEQVQAIEQKKGVVCFQHVDFKYPGAEENVLEDIDFVAEPGKTLAIIGSTGCGKSTLVNLIPRFYDVTGGSISIDGVDVKNLSLKELREMIGFVPQKGVLFSGTIASNLRFGNRNATEEEIREAAEIAQAADFIEEKHSKYQSAISQGGTNVSGGQKQRLSIARAIAKHPKIFVFDDSFSALDMKTDAALRKALGEKISESTIIIVAQRVSTILHADQILVLEDGKIVGKGSHEELLKNCEEYLQIAKSQLSARELGIEEGKEEK